MHPIELEIVAPMLSTVDMSCRRCGLVMDSLGLTHRYRSACASEYPEDWKEAVEYISAWIREITSLYRHRIRIRVIDALTPLGLWKLVRHRVFRFPAFIIDQKHTYVGWDPRKLEAVLDDRIHHSIEAIK